MIDFTPIARLSTRHRALGALRAADDCKGSQQKVLAHLLENCARTKWGQKHGIKPGMTYAEYAKAMPICQYEDLRPYVMEMVQGAPDILWPGIVNRFAQSSGTSGGKSKYIPITRQGLKRNHYAGASLAAGLYMLRHPDSRMFAGKAMILGGSFANELDLPPGVKVGDLSANLIECISPIANMFRVPRKPVALLADWSVKLPALVEASVHENITNISGVPSWFLTVLKGVLAQARDEAAKAGAPLPANVRQIWPELEVFFHGGIAFGPYRKEYEEVVGPGMRYWETYNASEGFFASQSEIGDHAMLLLVNIGVFYEFQPLDGSDPIPAWEAEPGKTYSMIISSCNGLWRYALGDTVRIESVNPVKITIAGRTHHFINAFGEELMVYNADAAIANTCKELGCAIANYTAAPVYTHGNTKGRHQWLIEWDTPPQDIEHFADVLDTMLQRENSDYQAKRAGSIFLDRLQVVTAPQGLFDRWLSSTGKLGGQRKVPRLCNDRALIDQLLALMPPTQ